MKMNEFFGLLSTYKRDIRSKGSNNENKRVDLEPCFTDIVPKQPKCPE